MAGRIKINSYIHYFSVSVMKHHDWSNLQKDEIIFIYGSRKFGCTMVGTVGRHTWHQLQEAERSPLQLQSLNRKGTQGRAGLWNLHASSHLLHPARSLIGLPKEHHKLVICAQVHRYTREHSHLNHHSYKNKYKGNKLVRLQKESQKGCGAKSSCMT